MKCLRYSSSQILTHLLYPMPTVTVAKKEPQRRTSIVASLWTNSGTVLSMLLPEVLHPGKRIQAVKRMLESTAHLERNSAWRLLQSGIMGRCSWGRGPHSSDDWNHACTGIRVQLPIHGIGGCKKKKKKRKQNRIKHTKGQINRNEKLWRKGKGTHMAVEKDSPMGHELLSMDKSSWAAAS